MGRKEVDAESLIAPAEEDVEADEEVVINEGEDVDTLEEFRAGATEHPGSWWPDWIDWLHQQDDATVPAKGKRKPGGKGDTVIEDAPGRYVSTR